MNKSQMPGWCEGNKILPLKMVVYLTQPLIENAYHDNLYIILASDDDDIQYVHESNMNNYSRDYPRDIFIPTYRIVGSRQDVIEALRDAGNSENDIRDALLGAISGDNDTIMTD